MKRFFCTDCQRVRRVEVLPTGIDTPSAEKPQDRIGRCDWHRYASHGDYLRSRRVGRSSPTRTFAKESKPQSARPAASFKPSKARRNRNAQSEVA